MESVRKFHVKKGTFYSVGYKRSGVELEQGSPFVWRSICLLARRSGGIRSGIKDMQLLWGAAEEEQSCTQLLQGCPGLLRGVFCSSNLARSLKNISQPLPSAAFLTSAMILKSSFGDVNPLCCSLCACPAKQGAQLLLPNFQFPGQQKQARQKHIFKCLWAQGYPCIAR